MRKILLLLFLVGNCAVVFGQIGLNQFRRNNLELNYTNPKEYQIAEITVTGVEYLDHNALISLSGLKVGDKIRIPGDDISRAIDKLWNQGIIGDISINATKVVGGMIYLDIALTERPRLRTVIFKGVSSTHESDLKDKIEISKGRVVTESFVKNTQLSVKNYFVEKGFLDADVTVVQQKDSLLANHVNLLVTVDKKYKIKIYEIEFEGLSFATDTKLKSKMKKTKEYARISVMKDIANRIYHFEPATLGRVFESDFITKEGLQTYINQNVKLNFFNGSKFIRSEYDNDLDALITYYNSKGYRDATIVDDTVFRYNDTSIKIGIDIDEGNQYYFGNITWTGNYVHPDALLSRILAIEPGDVYDMELLNKRLQFNPTGSDVSSLYMDDGYLFFRVNPIEANIDGDSIDVEIRIVEGIQATINKVIIKGNDQTHDHVIRRELYTQPGDKFSRSNIIKTNQRLAQLGYFDPEQIDIVPLPNPNDGTVDIMYTLVEQSNDQVELSGGWGGAYGFVGTLGLVLNNFSVRNLAHPSTWRPIPRGDGQRLAIRFQANGRQYQSYSLTFTEPWLGGKKPNAFSMNLSRSVQRTIDPYTNRTFGSLKLSGLTFSLGRRIPWPDDYFTLTNAISFLHYELNNQNSSSLGYSTGDANSFTFTTTLARNSVDNPTYPRSGSQLSLSLILTPPYSLFQDKDYSDITAQEKYQWIEYNKWMFDASFFNRIVGDLVINTRAHFGIIGAYSKDLGVGPFERYVMGGSGLAGQNFLLGTDVIGLRGYEDNSIVPYDPQTNISGGVAFSKFVMELRYPISLNPGATIYVLGFAEAGNNWGHIEYFDPFNLKRSAGFGARIFMPAFGLIGLDWGYGFDPAYGRLEPSGAQFHFTIGAQIR